MIRIFLVTFAAGFSIKRPQKSARKIAVRQMRMEIPDMFNQSPRDWASGDSSSKKKVGDDGIFNSMVQEEADKLFKDFEMLSKMQPNFFSMDLEGKKLFAKEMQNFLDRLVVFTKRIEMSDDPKAVREPTNAIFILSF
ncbi:MAG: DUF1825 family protein [Bacteroidota bacterium]